MNTAGFCAVSLGKLVRKAGTQHGKRGWGGGETKLDQKFTCSEATFSQQKVVKKETKKMAEGWRLG